VSVIALIGERGREVPEFIHDTLGEEGLARSVIVVATSDESPAAAPAGGAARVRRGRALPRRGRDVLLMMDSVTRFAHARGRSG
jgi:flagellum-specific ATP synthase